MLVIASAASDSSFSGRLRAVSELLLEAGADSWGWVLVHRQSLLAGAVLVGSTLLVWWLVRRYRRRKANSLAACARSLVTRRRPTRWILDLWRGLYLPSWPNALLLGVVATAFSAVPRLAEWLHHAHGWNWLQAPVQLKTTEVLAGLSAVALAIIILVAEGLRSAGPYGEGRVYLRQSLAFPLMLVSVVLLLGSAAGANNTWGELAPLVTLGVIVTVSLVRLLKLSLDPVAAAAAQDELNRERLRESAQEVLIERAALSTLAATIARLDGLHLGFFSRHASRVGHAFLAERSGVVTDVHLDKLEALATLLRRAPVAGVSGEPGEVSEGLVPEVRTQLFVRFGEAVEKGECLLAADGRLQLSAALRSDVRRLLGQAVDIEAQPPRSQFEHLMEHIRLRLLQALRETDRGAVEDGCRLFLSLMAEYQSLLVELGARFTKEQTQAEDRLLLGSLATVEVPSDALHELIEEAVSCSDRRIGRLVASLPMLVVRQAIRAGDHLICDRFLRVHESVATCAYAAKSTTHGTDLAVAAWQLLRETAQTHMSMRLEEVGDRQETESLGDIGKLLLRTHGAYLRCVLERGAAADPLLAEALSCVMRPNHLDEELRSEIEELDLSMDLGVELEPKQQSRLNLKRSKLATLEELRRSQHMVILGVGGWLTERAPETGIEDREQKVARVLENLPERFTDLFDALSDAMARDAGDEWDWQRWAADATASRSGAWVSDGTRGIITMFIAGALRSDLRIPAEHPLPANSDLKYLMQGDASPVRVALRSVVDDPNSWQDMLDATALSKVRRLETVLGEIAERLQAEEDERAAARGLSQARVRVFGERTREAYVRKCVLRRLFSFVDRVTCTEQGIRNEDRRFRIRELREKALFVDESPSTEVERVASDYGRRLAHSVDGLLLSAIADGADSEIQAEGATAVDEILRIGSEYAQEDGSQLVLLMRMRVGLRSTLRQHRAFRHKDESDGHIGGLAEAQGFLETEAGRRIWLVALPGPSAEVPDVLVDLSMCGSLSEVAFKPSEDFVGAHGLPPLLVRVADLRVAAEERERFLRTPPQWLREMPENRRETYLAAQLLLEVATDISFQKGAGKVTAVRWA